MKWLKGIFKRRDKAREHRLKAIEIVGKIKDAVNSQFLTDVTRITRWKGDDRALAVIRTVLPKILWRLQLTGRVNPEVAVYDAIQNLKAVPGKSRGAYYKSIAGDIYSELSGTAPDLAMEEIQKEYDVVKASLPT